MKIYQPGFFFEQETECECDFCPDPIPEEDVVVFENRKDLVKKIEDGICQGLVLDSLTRGSWRDEAIKRARFYARQVVSELAEDWGKAGEIEVTIRRVK